MEKVELDTKPLTKTQISTLEYLMSSIKLGHVPSIHDICMKFGMSSTNGAASRIFALERKGYISKVSGSSRSIKIERNVEGEYLTDSLLQTTQELLDIIEARGHTNQIHNFSDDLQQAAWDIEYEEGLADVDRNR